jgi:hypothetical protein
MTRNEKIPWKRISVEAAAIVASILLAFAIDAWWDERQLREEEREILTNLLIEFTRLEEEIYDARRYYGGILASARALIEIGVGTRDAVDGGEIDRLFGDIMFYGDTRDWISSDIDSLISSGDIALISSRELRQHLGRWPAYLTVVREFVYQDQNFYHDRFKPYLSENMYLPQMANWSQPIPGLPERTPYSWGTTLGVPSNSDHRKLVSKREFQNLLYERAGNLDNILFGAIGVKDENRKSRANLGDYLITTVELIERELAVQE